MKALVTNAAADTGLVAARSLAAAGFEVVGVDTLPLLRAARSRYLTAYHRLEGASAAERERALLQAVERVRPDVFLPLGTGAVRTAARRREALAAVTALNVVDRDAFEATYDKCVCADECRRLGLPTPAAYSLEEGAEALRSGEARTLVVKPARDVGAAAGVRYVRDAPALAEAAAACAARYGGYVIQEFVPGGAEAMRTVIVLFSRGSELRATFTMRKLRHWPPTGGPTAAGRSTADTDLVDLVLPYFRRWAWRGPAEVELKLDPRDGRYKVIEINPRFPGYLRFAWHCGLDLPLLAARLALDDLPLVRPYRVGAAYVAPLLFLQTVRADVRVRGARRALGRAAMDLRGAGRLVAGTFADPLPLVARVLTRPAP